MIDATDLRRLRRGAARVVRTRYPPFLFGRAVPRGEIPVFVYHDVAAAELEADLDFLAVNGYRTLSLEAFEGRMRAGAAERERAVLLCFDDARRSFRETAYPVLHRRGARAAVFAPTHWIGAPGFMTWGELAECRGSGRIDVQPHGHRHALVHVSTRLAGFATPRALATRDLFDWPLRREDGREVSGPPPLGTPVYEAAPLLSADARVLEPPRVASLCRALVAAHGGAAFFERAGWADALRGTHDAAWARHGPAEPLSGAGLERCVAEEIRESVESFERRLGERPRYFAYPWMLGSPRSRALLAAEGVRAAFGVALDFRRARREAGPPPVYGRYKADWLRFLPGRGRARLERTLARKLSSFARSQHLAH